MNARRIAVAAACAPVAIVLVVLTLVLGLGGGFHDAQATQPTAVGPTSLNTSAVPQWAREPLLAAAEQCPEVTAPILAAQLDTESSWNPDAYNPGSQATGLAQFIPSTWAAYGTDGDGDGHADPRNPADAIASQAVYMCHLIELVKASPNLEGETIDLALAAYNAGPGNVTAFGGIPPFPETTNYVTKIRRLASSTYATIPAASAGGTVGEVIQAAAAHVGTTMYAWGGGTLNGPGPGSAPDVGVVGFDCSSLVRYAYYQGSGHRITLPRTAHEQYQATRGQSVPVDQLQPGDLLFWGHGRIHHVALYIGDGRMIEAPQSGQPIQETPIRTDGDFAGATRVLGGGLDR